MKPFIINKQHPFHAWVFRHAGIKPWMLYEDSDLCWYIRRVIVAFIFFTLKVAVILAAVFMIGGLCNILGNMVFHYLFDHLQMTRQAMLTWWLPVYVIVGAASVFVLLMVVIAFLWLTFDGLPKAVMYVFKRRHNDDEPEKKPGFFITAYRSWKGKYCLKIKVTDE